MSGRAIHIRPARSRRPPASAPRGTPRSAPSPSASAPSRNSDRGRRRSPRAWSAPRRSTGSAPPDGIAVSAMRAPQADARQADASVLLQCSSDASRARMSVDAATVRHIARLARIAVSDAEVAGARARALQHPRLDRAARRGRRRRRRADDRGDPQHAAPARRRGHRGRSSATRSSPTRPLAEHGFFAVPKVIE